MIVQPYEYQKEKKTTPKLQLSDVENVVFMSPMVVFLFRSLSAHV